MNNDSNKKNGFTLVELLAVIVILIVIFLIAIFATNKFVDRSRENAFVAEANVIVKGAMEKYSLDKSDGNMDADIYSSNKPGRVCYSIQDTIIGTTVEKSNAEGYTGSVEVCSGNDCTYNSKIWLHYGDYYIEAVDGDVKKSDIKDGYETDYDLTCGEALLYGGTKCDNTSCEYDYTGKTRSFRVPFDGLYSLETWGAQGGYYKEAPYHLGGYGGYSYGEIELKKNETLYIVVGGKGNDSDGKNGHDGYNGGGAGGVGVSSNSNGSGGGGGATSIAFADGLLSTLTNKKDYIVIVAGGGSGAQFNYPPGNGGGYKGGTITYKGNVYDGGTQTTGYGLGQGYPTAKFCGRWAGGGGSGYYGANIAGDNCDPFSLGGGSGFINYPLLKNKYMYGYNVPTSDEEGTKTYTTNNVSDKPVKNYAKRGDGYAKITYLGTNNSGD
jgi:type II secretory pathway pseudopilin PulG